MNKNIWKSNQFIFLLVSSTVLIFYFMTVSIRLTWANFGNDGGDFLAAILTVGIPHPTGYPTYTVLGILFQQFPFGDPYFKTAMLSWLPAAIGAGLLALWVRQVLNEKRLTWSMIIPILTGLIWGLMPFLWSQAVIIEVHGLQSLFIVLTLWWLWWLLQFDSKKSASLSIFLLAFCFGLALGNHITIVLMLPAIFFSLFRAYRCGLSLRFIFLQGLAVFLGALIYLYLPLRAAQFPAINWGNPQTWQGFWWVVSGNPYQNLLNSTPLSMVFTRLSALAGLLLQQFGVVGVILAVIGAIQYKHQQKSFDIVLVYLFFIFSIFSIVYATDDSLNYLLTAFLVFTLWIAFGLSTIVYVTWKKFPVGFGLFALYLTVFFFTIPKTIQQINPREQTHPADYAEYILSRLPENVILLTSSDPDSFPLWYYHFGLGWRPDVRIIVLPLTQFRWYQETLTHTYPDLYYPPLITQTTNNSQSWGESIPDLNPIHAICKSSIARLEDNSIIVECSTGQNFNFVISD